MITKLTEFKLYERIKTLGTKFTNDLKKIYEMDNDAIVCGSTALYIYGAIDRMPNDIDIITTNKTVFETIKFIKENDSSDNVDDSDNSTQPEFKNFEPRKITSNFVFGDEYKLTNDFFDFSNNISVDKGVFKNIINSEYVQKYGDFKSNLEYLIENEVPMFTVPKIDNDDLMYTFLSIAQSISKFPQDTYPELYGRLAEQSGPFKFEFTAVNENKITVYSIAENNVPVITVDFDGIKIQLEALNMILDYKRFYNRTKDVKDLQSIKTNEASFKTMSSLSNIVKDLNTKPDSFYPEYFSDELKARLKESGLTSSNVFSFASMFPRDSFKIQDIISGKLAARTNQITFNGPGLDADLKKIEVLKEIVLAMDAWYGDRSWTLKY
jgi:hypothetical protein